ncbi:unnamed protein product [Blepharisma stoltei]|uniref:Uncharacterized protein n=1 Tax=Blepharisma stoltei TaxID=1481888 RepID=A0AAU9IYN2_9CILI|nr:unnamed protein product [Blepharisma stoltei]
MYKLQIPIRKEWRVSNKNDLPGALGVSELIDKLDLYPIRGKNWYIQSTCAITGDGLNEGLEWLSNAIISRST